MASVAIRDELDIGVREVSVLQLPISTGGEVFGVVIVRTFRAEGFTDRDIEAVRGYVADAAEELEQIWGAETGPG